MYPPWETGYRTMRERLQPCYDLADRLALQPGLKTFQRWSSPGEEGYPLKSHDLGKGTSICWIENISRGSRLAGGNPDVGSILANFNPDRRLLGPRRRAIRVQRFAKKWQPSGSDDGRKRLGSADGNIHRQMVARRFAFRIVPACDPASRGRSPAFHLCL